MVPTFDEASVEPTVLPARFPQLLVNGTTGIGVGMATNIPPHNLGEVINATICLLENPTASVSDLLEHMPGPDYPTGAIMRGIHNIHRLYATGKGGTRIRSRAEIEENDKGREQIVVTEIPYAVNKEMMVKKIADLVNEVQSAWTYTIEWNGVNGKVPGLANGYYLIRLSADGRNITRKMLLVK